MSTHGPTPPDPTPDVPPDDKWTEALRQAAGAYPTGEPGSAKPARDPRALHTVPDTRHGAPAADRSKAPAFPGFDQLEDLSPGVGGMGAIYLAREHSLDRTVALKTVKQALVTPAGREIFIREARSVAQLDHPHIVGIFSFNLDHDPPYFVMEYVDGEPIDRACRGKTPDQIARLLELTARALAYAHAQGILHRDIKPDNVLVDRKGAPRIMDFGLASRWGPARTEDDPAPVAGGTPSYEPPEGWEDGAVATPAVDIYSLGVMMYRLLTGQHPFEGDSHEALRAAIQKGRPRLPVDCTPDLPEPLQRICLQAMEHDPAHRYARAEDVADDLRRYLDGREVHARPLRYREELAGRLRTHVTDIRQWHEQNLIPVPDMDRLTRPYHRLLDGVSHWREFSHRSPWEAILLRLGGWLVLVSCLLWPLFYWLDLSRGQRLAGVGIPLLLLNAAGLLFLRRERRLNATIFLSTGALLLPVFVVVLLVEFEWLRWPGTPAVEWHGTPEDLELPTNVQLTVAVAAFVGYCLLLFRRLRTIVFTAWIGVGVYLLGIGVWLILGLMERIAQEDIAFPILTGLVLPGGFYLGARAVARTRAPRWAAAFYAFFPVPLVILLTLLAIRGATEWYDASLTLTSRGIGHWLMLNGLLYGALGFLHGQSRQGFVRGWSLFFLLVLPLSLLIPLNLLFREGPTWFTLGEAPVTPYEPAALAATLILIVGGIHMGREILTLPGLCGLAVCLFHIAFLHFPSQRGWPLGLLITGATAMLAGLALSRIRKTHEMGGVSPNDGFEASCSGPSADSDPHHE